MHQTPTADLTRRAARAGCAAAVACLVASCGSDGPSAPREVPAQIELLGSASRVEEVGSEIDGPRVRVRGSLGNAMPGITITCFIAAGAGTLSTPTVTTELDGTATCGRWTLSQQTEVAIARATAPELDTVQVAVNVRPGPATKLALARGIGANVFSDLLVDPQPLVEATDRFGNRVLVGSLAITARTDVPAIIVYGATALTAPDGRASYSRLGFSGPAGPFVVTFDAAGLQSVSTPSASLQPAPPGASVPARLVFRAAPKIVVIDPAQRATVPPIDAFNASEIPLPLAITRLSVRSPSLVSGDGDTALVALGPGRAFVAAQSIVNPAAIDSLLVYLTHTATGPLLRTDLTTFELAANTDIEMRVVVEMRNADLLSGATVDVAYPRDAPGLMTLLGVTPSNGTIATASTTAGLVRLAYANATGAGGTVELARFVFRVNSDSPNVSQIVLTPVDIVSATLQNLTSTTTAMNPPFVVRP